MTSEIIYKQVEPNDLNPEERSWYYDNYGNRMDKKTDKPVVIIQSVSYVAPKTLLTEDDISE